MSTDTQLQTVVERVEAFLADHDPKSMDDREFRGARFDAGLAWVHFPEGLGGLGDRSPNSISEYSSGWASAVYG